MTLGLINANPVGHAKKERILEWKIFDPVEIHVNKQFNYKEKVVAALENPNLRQLVDEWLHSNELFFPL